MISLLNKANSIESVSLLGGKGAALARLARGGFSIPATLCLHSTAYDDFLAVNGTCEKIQLELARKDFKEMRWEEIWDASLRIRNLFLNGRFPDQLSSQIRQYVERHFAGKAMAVRSSAPDEDAGHTSFAGLHESYLDIRGVEQLFDHIKKVWASLWNDRALLYRQELGLDARQSRMAVVIQDMIDSDKSGIVFSQHPDQPGQMVIESVYGFNQGLVDGEIEPDRWIVARENGSVLSFSEANQPRQAILRDEHGLHQQEVVGRQAARPPLSNEELAAVGNLALELEKYFGGPQDCEWTFSSGKLIVLQSRPVTSLAGGDQKDMRSWYFSLHRSFGNLIKLQQEIEGTQLPAMAEEAKALEEIELESISDLELAAEVERRMAINQKWVDVYWQQFIPFAHGMRLFGEVYNDLVKPDDPFEFVSLLAGNTMLSTARNKLMAELAALISEDPQLADQLKRQDLSAIAHKEFLVKLDQLKGRFGNLFSSQTGLLEEQESQKMLFAVLGQFAKKPMQSTRKTEAQEKVQLFLEKARLAQLAFSGQEILDLGRASYRLRDDDNIYLGRIEQQLAVAIGEARKRLDDNALFGKAEPEVIIKALRGEKRDTVPGGATESKETTALKTQIKARQLTGQPAARGIARGPCRLIQDPRDLAAFQEGEILVVDAIDPNMTFVAPLAAAIVERRGGMLIHGAIIAREYGIPCVTGIPEAMKLIPSGQVITVDGYLGIVTLGGKGDE